MTRAAAAIIDAARRELNKINESFPERLTRMDPEGLARVSADMAARGMAPPAAAWRSRRMLAALYHGKEGLRLSVNLARLRDDGQLDDALSWDDLQRAKAECGFGAAWAVEVFPPDAQVVDVANLRHLWLLDAAPDYGWRG